MSSPYPLQVVVSNSPSLSKRYNDDVHSLILTSKCVSVEEFLGMLEQGLDLQRVLLVNGAAKEYLLGYDNLNWQQVNIDAYADNVVQGIHRLLEDEFYKV